MNDPNSRVSKLIAHPRHYRMLEEMNFRPTVGYLTKIRNRPSEQADKGVGEQRGEGPTKTDHTT